MGQAWRPDRPRLRQPLGRGTVQGGAGDDHVRPLQSVVTVGDDQVEAARVHARVLDLDHRRAAPAACGADRTRCPSGGEQQPRWRRRQTHRHERRRPTCRGKPGPGSARMQRHHPWRQPGRLGEAERLGLQTGIGFTEYPAFRRHGAVYGPDGTAEKAVQQSPRPAALGPTWFVLTMFPNHTIMLRRGINATARFLEPGRFSFPKDIRAGLRSCRPCFAALRGSVL